LTTCNPRKINCTGRESNGHTNCSAELSTLEISKRFVLKNIFYVVFLCTYFFQYKNFNNLYI
jgi:hypothetical protein